jgi:hypothetical protein
MPVPIIAPALGLLGRMIASRVGQWIATALVWFGLSVSAQNIVMQPMIDNIMAMVSSGPAIAVQMVQALGLDQAIVMILSAYTARAAATGVRAFLARRRGAP